MAKAWNIARLRPNAKEALVMAPDGMGGWSIDMTSPPPEEEPEGITEVVQIGVGCVLTDEEGRFLLSERLTKHGEGQWSFPGGKPDPGERPDDAALRELEEETGIRANFAVPLGIWTYEQWPDHGIHFVTLYFMIEHGDQQPHDREPDKHGPWEWVSYEDAVQRPLFDGIAQVVGLLG